MDALSDVLRAVRLTGAVYFDVDASAPWVATTPEGRTIVGAIFPGADHLIHYHAVTRGDCWASVADEAPIHLTAGDIIVFPHGDTHTLSSAPDQRSAPDMARFRPPDDGQLPFVVTMGVSDAGAAHLVCGFLGCDTRPFNPLLATLPRVIRVGGG